MFYFNTHSNAVSITRETKTALYDVIIYPDGNMTYAVNGEPVMMFPVLPSTKQVCDAANRMKELAISYLNADTEKKVTAWWVIKAFIKTLNE